MSVAGCHRFDHRRVLVTGSAQGIGSAIARRFAREGAHVFIADLDLPGARDVAESLTAEGGSAEAVELDIRSERSVSQAFEDVGELDVVVANAGVQQFSAIEDLPASGWDRTLEINARGTFLTLREAARHIVEGGSATAIASIQGYLANPLSVDYAASKAAILSIVRSFAIELAPRAVRVNAVAPGRIDTSLSERANREIGVLTGVSAAEIIAKRLESNPLGRPGTPDDVAAAALFLSSPDAGYITGIALDVCGGDVMR